MADGKIELIFDPVLNTITQKKLVDDAEKLGGKAGKSFGSEFGKKSAKFIGGSFKSVFGSFAGKATAAIGVVVAAFSTKQIVQAASVQQDAINALNSSLELSKNASITASEGIQAYASELQSSTRFGDEVLLQNAALIQSLGDLDKDGLKRALKATTDLSTALRIDLTSAATLVGKAAGGNVASFSRFGLTIGKGANKAETFAKALTAIESKFGGAAQKDVFTFTGALQQLENTFGDLQEALGASLTQSPKVIALFKGLSDGLGKIITDVSKVDDSAFIDDVINGFLNVASVVNNVVIPSFVGIKRGFEFIVNAAATMVQGTIVQFAQMAKGAAKVIEFFGGGGELTESVKSFADDTTSVLAGMASDTADSFTKILDPIPFQERVNEIITSTGELVTNAKEITKEVTENTDTAVKSTFETIGQRFEGAKKQIQDFGKTFTVTSKDIAKSAITGLGNGVGSGFAAMGKALVNGENALEAFGKAFLASMGQAMVSLGTRFILEGIAWSLNPATPGIGGPLIGAGTALAVAGGALGAIGGGGGAGAGAGSGGGGVGANAITSQESLETAVVSEPEERTAQQGIVINVEGDFLDSEEGGLKILEALNKTFDTTGAVLRTGVA